jgi:hypothetical protein
LALGAIGDYVARNYEETKGRPLYVVSASVNRPLTQDVIPGACILPEAEFPDAASMLPVDGERNRELVSTEFRSRSRAHQR